MSGISELKYEQVRDRVYFHIRNNSLLLLKNYVKDCGCPLWKFNYNYSESDDILIYALEVDASEDLIEYIIKNAEYKNLNYHIRKKAKFYSEICDVNISPLMVALIKDRMQLFYKLIKNGAKITHIAEHNQVNIIIRNLEFFDYSLNKKYIYIKKLLNADFIHQIYEFYKTDMEDELEDIIMITYHQFINILYNGNYNLLKFFFNETEDILNELLHTDYDLIKAGIKYDANKDIFNLIVDQYELLDLNYKIYDENVGRFVTPIVYAITLNKFKIAEQLIEYGADINIGMIENNKNNIVDYLYKNNQLNTLNLRFIISYLYIHAKKISEFNISLKVIENLIENENNEILHLILKYKLYNVPPFKPLYKKALTSYNLQIFKELFYSDPLLIEERKKVITQVINNLSEEHKSYFEKWYPVDPFLYNFLK